MDRNYVRRVTDGLDEDFVLAVLVYVHVVVQKLLQEDLLAFLLVFHCLR